MLTRLAIAMVVVLGRLPLPWLRALGWLLGHFLYAVVGGRRRVVHTNLARCFPDRSASERTRLARRTFVVFAQSWLDRGWLWHAPEQVVRRRLRMAGAVDALRQAERVVLFAPHFYGLDAGGTALLQQIARDTLDIYSPQNNAVVDAWINRGRQRFGHVRLIPRSEGARTIVTQVRAGALLYLMPDMNFDPSESLFLPFFGVPAATVTSLARFARLGRAVVMPFVTRMTPQGYEVEVHAPWQDFPSADLAADTLRMNRELERIILTMPEQYYWLHRRFKDQPPGAPPVY